MKVKFKDGTVMGPEIGGYDYNILIKKRLIEWKQNFELEMEGMSLNYAKIADEIKNRYKIQTTAAKIGAMFNPEETRSIQLPELTALAQIFDIPIWDLCAHPVQMTTPKDYSSFVRKKRNPNTNIEPVTNDLYYGEYWAYYLRPKHYDGQINPLEKIDLEESRIVIAEDKNRSTLSLEEQKTTTTFDGKPMPSYTLTGDLYRFLGSNVAYSFITDPVNWKAMAIMFSYLNIDADIRYYMTAGMMTFSQNTPKSPLFQKMAIFKKRQDYKDKKTADIIRGILSLNSGPIPITESAIEKLIEENPSWKSVLVEEKALEKGYIFSESSIRDNLYPIEDDMEKMKMLLEVREKSVLPAHEIVCESDTFTDFIKRFQLQQNKDE